MLSTVSNRTSLTSLEYTNVKKYLASKQGALTQIFLTKF